MKLHIGHRDIKPENILLVGQRAKLTDFGFAKRCWNGKTRKPILNNTICGTPPYQAPEIGKKYDIFASDMWSMGVEENKKRMKKISRNLGVSAPPYSKHSARACLLLDPPSPSKVSKLTPPTYMEAPCSSRCAAMAVQDVLLNEKFSYEPHKSFF